MTEWKEQIVGKYSLARERKKRGENIEEQDVSRKRRIRDKQEQADLERETLSGYSVDIGRSSKKILRNTSNRHSTAQRQQADNAMRLTR